MNNKLKLILIVAGVVFVLIGGYLTWTALYPGVGEFQELTVADYISGKSIDVSVHYPLRVLIGKTSQIRVKYDAATGLIPGSALDQELDLPGFVVTPQKRQMTTLNDGQKGTAAWKIVPVSPEKAEAVVTLALESVPNGMFALSPTAQATFKVDAFKILGMDYTTMLKTGLVFLLVGALAVFVSLKLKSAQPKLIKRPHIYG